MSYYHELKEKSFLFMAVNRLAEEAKTRKSMRERADLYKFSMNELIDGSYHSAEAKKEFYREIAVWAEFAAASQEPPERVDE